MEKLEIRKLYTLLVSKISSKLDISDYQVYEAKKLKRFLGIFKTDNNHRQGLKDHLYLIWCWFMAINITSQIGKTHSAFGLRDFLAYWPMQHSRWQVLHTIGWLNISLLVSWSYLMMKFRPGLMNGLLETEARKIVCRSFAKCHKAVNLGMAILVFAVICFDISVLVSLGEEREWLDYFLCVYHVAYNYYCTQIMTSSVVFICHRCHNFITIVKRVQERDDNLLKKDLEMVEKELQTFNSYAKGIILVFDLLSLPMLAHAIESIFNNIIHIDRMTTSEGFLNLALISFSSPVMIYVHFAGKVHSQLVALKKGITKQFHALNLLSDKSRCQSNVKERYKVSHLIVRQYGKGEKGLTVGDISVITSKLFVKMLVLLIRYIMLFVKLKR